MLDMLVFACIATMTYSNTLMTASVGSIQLSANLSPTLMNDYNIISKRKGHSDSNPYSVFTLENNRNFTIRNILEKYWRVANFNSEVLHYRQLLVAIN